MSAPYQSVVPADSDAMNETSEAQRADFEAFARDSGERLRRVLVAGYGVEVGNDLCADALAYAWEHWSRIETLDNPAGYLYRVAQSAHRRHRRWRRRVPLPVEHHHNPDVPDPELGAALGRLTRHQRSCVVLVHVYDCTYQQAADLLDLPLSSVRNHVHRGLAALRKALEP